MDRFIYRRTTGRRLTYQVTFSEDAAYEVRRDGVLKKPGQEAKIPLRKADTVMVRQNRVMPVDLRARQGISHRGCAWGRGKRWAERGRWWSKTGRP